MYGVHNQHPTTHFDKFVLSFSTLCDGFKLGCRPFIGINKCHLKGPFKGVLLSAVTLYGNNGIQPLVICVCGTKSSSTWTWFLGQLREFLCDSRQLTFMCDRQKGIHNALSIEFRIAHVKYCARHIFANVKAKHTKTNFKAHFWAASRASNTRDFDAAMERLKSVDSDAFNTIRKINHKFWSRHAFNKTCKSDHCTNNMIGSFNA